MAFDGSKGAITNQINTKDMKPILKEFTVWIPTKLGMGIIKVKAKDFKDAFRRLGKKDKVKDGYIEDEQGDSVTFNEILGCQH